MSDLYQKCEHCWHPTRKVLSATMDYGKDTRAEDRCCHCGVHRWSRIDRDGKRSHGPYAPPKRSNGKPVYSATDGGMLSGIIPVFEEPDDAT